MTLLSELSSNQRSFFTENYDTSNKSTEELIAAYMTMKSVEKVHNGGLRGLNELKDHMDLLCKFGANLHKVRKAIVLKPDYTLGKYGDLQLMALFQHTLGQSVSQELH